MIDDTKIAKLFRLMESDNDGEALQAARAFLKECKRGGLDAQTIGERITETEEDFAEKEIELRAEWLRKKKEQRLKLTPAQIRWMARYIACMPQVYGGSANPLGSSFGNGPLCTKADATPHALTKNERHRLHSAFLWAYDEGEFNCKRAEEYAANKARKEFWQRRLNAQAKAGLGWNLGEFINPEDVPVDMKSERLEMTK
jgi:hypothetical protein